MTAILTITLNPAVDITMTVDTLRPQDKLRARDVRYDPGGGGINVARTVNELGGWSPALAVTGGHAGDHLLDLARDAGLEIHSIPGTGTNRESVKVYEAGHGHQYRFVPPGPEQSPEIARAVLDRTAALMAEADIGYIVASGSVPPGIPDDFFARLVRIGQDRGAEVIVDTAGPALATAAGAGVFLIKPNIHEVTALCDTAENDYRAAARRVLSTGELTAVIVTLGPDGAFVVTRDREFQLRPPVVTPVSTVGAGDSFIGALSYGLGENWPFEDACRLGVAAATAAVLTPATELARKPDIFRIYPDVGVSG